MIPAEKYFGVSVSALRDTTTALEHRAPLSCEAGSWKIFLGYASYGYEQGVRNGFAPKFPTLKIPFKKFFEAARVCEVFAQKKFFLFAAKFAARDFAGSPEVCPPKFADTTSWRGGMTSKPACLLAEFDSLMRFGSGRVHQSHQCDKAQILDVLEQVIVVQ